MNRQIKFRGKSKKTGKWLYGCVADIKYTNFVGVYEKKVIFGNLNIFHTDNFVFVIDDCEVIPETIGQFTGFCDSKGKEIYDDDIVKWEDSDNNVRTNTVVWRNGGFVLCNSCYTVCSYMGYNLEVIGNIHDTPELLNDK